MEVAVTLVVGLALRHDNARVHISLAADGPEKGKPIDIGNDQYSLLAHPGCNGQTLVLYHFYLRV